MGKRKKQNEHELEGRSLGESGKSRGTLSKGTSSMKFPLELQFEFAEMNIHYVGNADKTIALVRRAIRMGYDAVVINIDINDLSTDVEAVVEQDAEPVRKKKNKGGSRVTIIPDPFIVDESKLDFSSLELAGKRFRQFSRLTVTLSDTTAVHTLLHHPQLRKYDVVAVRPGNESILQILSRKGEFVDIITYDQASSSVPWLYKAKLIQTCMSEGISFEISYSDALKNSRERRQIFSNGRMLLLASRSGNGIILSSGATELLDLRAPFDSANLGVLFGLEPHNVRQLVSGNAKKVLLRAESRKTIKGAVFVTDANKVPSTLVKTRSALERLISIPEFRAQLEIVTENSDEKPVEPS